MADNPSVPGRNHRVGNAAGGVFFLALVVLSTAVFCPHTKGQPDPVERNVKYAGARSSAYGIRPFPSPEGWINALKTMAGYFPGSTPVGIWIVK